MNTNPKRFYVFDLIGVGLTATMLASCTFPDRLHAKPRKEWKNVAVAEIGKRVTDLGWLEKEVAAIKAKVQAEKDAEGNWLSSDMLVMKNGDWIVYAAKCSKEDASIHDIFIGRASDGKWYFSTYHFCVHMVELRMQQQPTQLAKFVSAFSLREFDGRSDECLKKTWPPTRP